VAEQEEADIAHEVGIAEQVEHVVAADAAAGEHADSPIEALGRVPGVLHRLPRRHQEVAVLGVHDAGFLRGEPEEVGVEVEHPVERAGRLHVAGAAHLLAGDAGIEQLVVSQVADALDPVAQIVPVLAGVARARQVGRDSHNRDVVL